MKRILSLILCIAMVLTMIPAQVFAEETAAVWTVSFDANGGKGTMDALTLTEEGGALTANGFTWTCHVFTGWNTAKDGSGTGYTDGQTVTLTEDLTLYAQWKLQHSGKTIVKFAQAPGCDTEGYSGNTFCADCNALLATGEGVAPTGHKWQAATCTVPKTCSVCLKTEGTSLGHTAGEAVTEKVIDATCTAAGSYDTVVYCTTCSTEISRTTTAVAAKGHTEVVDKAVAPTCTATGLTEGKHCSVCKAVLVKQETVSSLGHTPGEAATCTGNQICTVCKAELNPAKGHTEVVDKAVAPTCTETGLTEGKHCSVCGVVLVAQETVPALGHTEEIIPPVAPDCINTGLTEGKKCSVCGEILAAQEEVPALGHTEAVDAAVAATCTETGLTEGKHCSVCSEVLVAQETVPALDHAWGEAVYSDFRGGTHRADYVCTNDAAHTKTETVAHVYDENTEECACSKKKPLAFGNDEQLYWEVYSDGKLTVLGTGAIRNGTAWEEHSGLVKEIFVDDGITAIGEDAFAGFAALETLTFPVGAAVGKGAFEGCTGLKEITLTGSGKMADYTATSCTDLPWFKSEQTGLRVNVAEGVTSIGAYGFCGAANVVEVKLPESLTAIGEGAFKGSGLRSITIPGTVTEIGSYALAELKSMDSLTLPASVTTLGEYALSNASFQAVELPANLTVIPEGLLEGCEKMWVVHIPETVKEIGKSAFENCKALPAINIPEGITEIPADAFRNSRLYSVIFPKSLERIGENAFSGNASLYSLNIQSVPLTVEKNAFEGCSGLRIVYFGGSQADWNKVDIKDGNNVLRTAKRRYATEGNQPVQKVHILHKAGLDFQPDEILDGRTILVNLDTVKSITLGYRLEPEQSGSVKTFWNEVPEDRFKRTEDAKTKNQVYTDLKPGDAVITFYCLESGGEISYVGNTILFQFREMVISGLESDFLSAGSERQLTAKIEGDGEVNRGIRWTIVKDETGEATLSNTGLLKVGNAEGQITIRAEAADGSGLAQERTVTVKNYSVVIINAPEMLFSGETVKKLQAKTVPAEMPAAKVAWELVNEEEDKAYVTLSGETLKVKNITEAHTVTVRAYDRNGKAASDEVDILVMPVVSAVTIRKDGADVTKQTVTVNLNEKDEWTLTLTALTEPEDALKDVKWTTSDSKGVYATYTPGDDGSYTLTATGEACKSGKFVTLTATSAGDDGSKKSATVKVVFIKTATSVQILNAPESIIAGSKFNLTTNVETEPGLTDRNVIWELEEGSNRYASINAKGQLSTVKGYPDQETIKLRAELKADPTVCSDWVSITLRPAAQAAQILYKGEVMAKNQVIYAAVGSTVELTGKILPAKASQGGTWKQVANLTDEGNGKATVTMDTVGSVTATFTAADGSKKSTAVKIQFIRIATDLTIKQAKGETEIVGAKSLQLTAVATGYSLKDYLWTVDNPAVATVTNKGKVQAKAVYENTKIVVTAAALDGSGLTATYELTIKPAEEKTLHIKMNGEVVTGNAVRYVPLGQKVELSTWIYNSATDSWREVNVPVTVVSKGMEELKEGIYLARTPDSGSKKGKLSVKAEGLSATANIKVVNPVEKITVYEKAGKNFLIQGKSLNMKTTVEGANGMAATVDKVTWSLEGAAAFATISTTGTLKVTKAVTEPTEITVIATAADGSGVTGSMKVTIYPKATDILIKDKTTGEQLKQKYKVGDVLALSAVVFPEGALQDVTFSINNKKIATLDENGNLHLLSKGNLTITATAKDDSKKKSQPVTIEIE